MKNLGLGKIQEIVGSDGMKTSAEMSIASAAGVNIGAPQVSAAFSGAASVLGVSDPSMAQTFG